MVRYKIPEDRDSLLVRRSLDELIEKDNIVRLIDVLIDKIVSENQERFSKDKESPFGASKYHDSVFLKLYLYGYMNRIKASRRLEQETYRNIEVKWLLGNLTPDHWTISNYRKDHPEDIKFVARSFRIFLTKMGYIQAEEVSIDGTKIKANTERSMLSLKKINKRLKSIDEKIEKYLKAASTMDQYDDLEERLDELGSEGLNRELIDKISRLQEELEKLKETKDIIEKQKRKTLSPTDPEAKLMHSREGEMPCYNVQMVVDKKHMMIVDTEVSTDENDKHQLKPMIKSMNEEVGVVPLKATLDNGYYAPEEIKKTEEEYSTEVFCSISKKKKSQVSFTYDESNDEFLCSEGKRLVLISKNKKKGSSSTANAYQGIECENCPVRQQCTTSKKGRRTVYRYNNQDWRDSYKEKMQSTRAREHLSERKSIIEHTFGTIKLWMGKIPLLLRGKKKVSTEIDIYSTAYNLKRLFNIGQFDDLIDEINGYNWEIA